MVLKIKQAQKSRSLTNDLADDLRVQIIDGKWKAGTKLPSSKDIEQAAGVSRTVVREAVAILKAEGLIESQQGVGVFVSKRKRNKLFSIDEDEFSSLEDAIKILELRMAVEIEMAGMKEDSKQQQQFYDDVCEEHCLIEDAIKSRDANRAKQALANHLNKSKERHLAIVDSLQGA